MVQVFDRDTGKRVYKGKSIVLAEKAIDALVETGKSFRLTVEA